MRYPPLTPEEMTPRQREVAEAIDASTPGGFCPPLLYSPEVAERVRHLASHLRTGLRLPERLRAVALLVAATRHRASDAAAFATLPEIVDSGLQRETIDALAEGRRPTSMTDDEAMIHEFCTGLTQNGRAKNTLFQRVADRFGREVCLELVALYGYTAFLTTVLNVTQGQLTEA